MTYQQMHRLRDECAMRSKLYTRILNHFAPDTSVEPPQYRDLKAKRYFMAMMYGANPFAVSRRTDWSDQPKFGVH